MPKDRRRSIKSKNRLNSTCTHREALIFKSTPKIYVQSCPSFVSGIKKQAYEIREAKVSFLAWLSTSHPICERRQTAKKHHRLAVQRSWLASSSVLAQAAKCHALLRTSTSGKRRHTTALSCTSCLCCDVGARRVCSPLFCFFPSLSKEEASIHPIMPVAHFLPSSRTLTPHITTHTTDTGTFNQAPRLLLRADSVVIALLSQPCLRFWRTTVRWERGGRGNGRNGRNVLPLATVCWSRTSTLSVGLCVFVCDCACCCWTWQG